MMAATFGTDAKPLPYLPSCQLGLLVIIANPPGHAAPPWVLEMNIMVGGVDAPPKAGTTSLKPLHATPGQITAPRLMPVCHG
jgi:hypothetical protein